MGLILLCAILIPICGIRIQVIATTKEYFFASLSKGHIISSTIIKSNINNMSLLFHDLPQLTFYIRKWSRHPEIFWKYPEFCKVFPQWTCNIYIITVFYILLAILSEHSTPFHMTFWHGVEETAFFHLNFHYAVFDVDNILCLFLLFQNDAICYE